jgi:hypothetical protein
MWSVLHSVKLANSLDTLEDGIMAQICMEI